VTTSRKVYLIGNSFAASGNAETLRVDVWICFYGTRDAIRRFFPHKTARKCIIYWNTLVIVPLPVRTGSV